MTVSPELFVHFDGDQFAALWALSGVFVVGFAVRMIGRLGTGL